MSAFQVKRAGSAEFLPFEATPQVELDESGLQGGVPTQKLFMNTKLKVDEGDIIKMTDIGQEYLATEQSKQAENLLGINCYILTKISTANNPDDE